MKHWFVVVSQQLIPLDGGGQLFWHCESVVHVATHILIGWLRSSVTKSARSAGAFLSLLLPQLAMMIDNGLSTLPWLQPLPALEVAGSSRPGTRPARRPSRPVDFADTTRPPCGRGR